jgi:hypothetical protein
VKLTEAIESVIEGAGKASDIYRVVDPTVREVATDMRAAFVASGEEEPEDYFTEDDETNRTIMVGVALANEINSEIDWAAVPAAVLKDGLLAMRAAVAIMAIL